MIKKTIAIASVLVLILVIGIGITKANTLDKQAKVDAVSKTSLKQLDNLDANLLKAGLKSAVKLKVGTVPEKAVDRLVDRVELGALNSLKTLVPLNDKLGLLA